MQPVKILVPCKRVPDTDYPIRVGSNGRDIDLDQAPFVINPFDAIALEEAIRMCEAGDASHVTAVGIGVAEYEKELRTALAMGADEAMLVEVDEPVDPWNVASILEAIVVRHEPSLVLMGKQAVDDDASQTGQFLAARLGWPQATFASEITFRDPSNLAVARETDQGIERIAVELPAVITVDLRLNEPRYASLPSIMKARKKTIETTNLTALGVTLSPKVRLVAQQNARASRNCRRVETLDALLAALGDDPHLNWPQDSD